MAFQILSQSPGKPSITLTAKITTENLSLYPDGVFHRPTATDGNRGWGFSKFKENEVAEVEPYLKEDVIYIKTCMNACSDMESVND